MIFVIETNHKFSLSIWLKDTVLKKAKSKNNCTSTISNLAWCNLDGKGDILKLHDECPSSCCNCQKQVTFTPKQFQLEGAGFKNRMNKKFERNWKKVEQFG